VIAELGDMVVIYAERRLAGVPLDRSR